MNYNGGYYPPTTYASGGSQYQRGTTTTAGYAASRSYTSTDGQVFGYPSSNTYNGGSYTGGAAYPNAYTSAAPASGYGYGTAGSYGNGTATSAAYGGGYTETTAGAANSGSGYDSNIVTAMHNMSFGK
jgi:hypothetical protein